MLKNTKFENLYQIVYEELEYKPISKTRPTIVNEPVPATYQTITRIEICIDGSIEAKSREIRFANTNYNYDTDTVKKLYEKICDIVNQDQEEFWPEEDGRISRIIFNYTYGVSEVINGDVEYMESGNKKRVSNIIIDFINNN